MESQKFEESLEITDFENVEANVNELVDDSLNVDAVQSVEDLLNAIC